MDDLISRWDVVECVYKALRTPPLKGIFTDTMSLAISMVNDLPSAPQRTGHWIQYGDEFCCSECGGWAYMDECDEGIKTHQSKFCPECGAKMEESEE